MATLKSLLRKEGLNVFGNGLVPGTDRKWRLLQWSFGRVKKAL